MSNAIQRGFKKAKKEKPATKGKIKAKFYFQETDLLKAMKCIYSSRSSSMRLFPMN